MGFQMKYQIQKQYLTAPSKRRPGVAVPEVRFIVAHDTGNPGSTAKGNIGYYERTHNSISASAHIFVDDKEIIECIPFLTGKPEKAWHVLYNVTTDNQMYGEDANDVALGVELCWGPGINSEEAYKRYIWVLAYACYKFQLDPTKAIVGHDVLDPGRKIDPSNALKYMGKTYQQFLKDVVNEYNRCVEKTVIQPAKPLQEDTYTIQPGDTFWNIAQRMKDITVQDLIRWNPTIDPSNLQVGQVISLKPPKEKTTKSTTKTDSKTNSKKTETKKNETKKKITLPNKTLKRGDRGNDVLAVQKALASLSFYPDKNAPNYGCDGIYGPKTENAVSRFQSVYVGDVDGIYGPKTKAALEKLLNK